MQSPEQIPILAVSVIITAIGLGVIYRGWWKTRNLTAFLYALTITAFSGMALDLLLDQTYMPFRQADIIINGERLWISNMLLAIFVIAGYLAWYFAIIVSQYEFPPSRTLLVAFLAGGSLLGAVLRADWSSDLVLLLQLLAFAILIVEIIRYGVRVLRVKRQLEERRQLLMYFLGFVVWIIAGPVGIVADSLNLGSFGHTLWVFPYSIGLLIVAYVVAKNPHVLIISETQAYDYMILDHEGTLIFAHRILEYSRSIDLELLGSAMSGVLSLFKEMLGSEQELNGINHGDVRILVEHGLKTTHLLVASRETPTFRQILRNLVLEFETNYRDELVAEAPLVTAYDSFRERIESVLI
ncbi:MAG: hypothetical protein ACTSYL_10480 [Candidatus Thorarchaeota archaeon]